MDTLRGLKVFRQDPEWLSKMLVMTVLIFIPYVGQIVVAGWSALLLRGLVRGRDVGWTPPLRFDFDYLTKVADPGFKAWLVSIAWSFPVAMLTMVVFGCVWFAMVLGIAGAAGAAQHAGGDAGGGIAALLPCLFPVLFLVMMPVIIAAQIPGMMAATRVELSGELKDGFNFGEVMGMTKLVFKETMISVLILTAVSIPLALLGELACFVGLFVVMYILWVARTHLQAQIYQLYLQKGGKPLTIASDEIVMPGIVPAPVAPPSAF